MRIQIAFALVLVSAVACSNDAEDCEKTNRCGGAGAGADVTGGAGSGMGAGGGVGGDTGGGGAGGVPGCMDHDECTTAAAAQCAMGSCVACTDSTHCAGVAGLPVCDAGTCIECKLGEEGACMGAQTCDLLAQTCVDVAPTSVLNCNACTNDVQCEGGHRCIEMDFESQLHGYYCLEEVAGSCNQPFQVTINKPSISGVAATDYCGIVEDLATCEAVNALLLNWRCQSGLDGMCSPDGIAAEQPVPGAICEQVGILGDRCTYACGNPSQCLDPGGSPEQSTCGTGLNVPPGWCGG